MGRDRARAPDGVAMSVPTVTPRAATVRSLAVWVPGILLIATEVLGVCDALIWTPQDLAPQVPLERIGATLASDGDLDWAVATFAPWPVVWSVLTALYLLVFVPLRRSLAPFAQRVPKLLACSIGLVLVGLAVFFQWWSEFAIAMSVSDALPPGVGGTSRFGHVFLGAGFIAGVAGVVGLAAAVLRARFAGRRPLRRS